MGDILLFHGGFGSYTRPRNSFQWNRFVPGSKQAPLVGSLSMPARHNALHSTLLAGPGPRQALGVRGVLLRFCPALRSWETCLLMKYKDTEGVVTRRPLWRTMAMYAVVERCQSVLHHALWQDCWWSTTVLSDSWEKPTPLGLDIWGWGDRDGVAGVEGRRGKMWGKKEGQNEWQRCCGEGEKGLRCQDVES